MELSKRKMGMVAEPYSAGMAGKLEKATMACAGGGALMLVFGPESPDASTVTASLVTAQGRHETSVPLLAVREGGAAGIFGVSQSLAVRFISPLTGSIVVLVLAVAMLRIRPLGLLRS